MKRTLVAGLVFALASCAAPPPAPPVLKLTIIGSTSQNPSPTGAGTTVAVNVYQLAATGKFQSTDFYSLTGHEAAVLGSDEVSASQQFLLPPGATLTETLALKPTVTNVGIAVSFRDIDHATWKLVTPVAASGTTALTLRIKGLTATIGSH